MEIKRSLFHLRILVLKSKTKRRAFSLIEIVFGVALFGILLTLAIPHLSINSRVCELDLSTRLATVQNKISILFTQAQLRGQSIDNTQILNLLNSLSDTNTTQCSFLLISKKTSLLLKATSKNQSTYFRIKPADLSNNPRIYCSIGDVLCRKITHRIKEK